MVVCCGERQRTYALGESSDRARRGCSSSLGNSESSLKEDLSETGDPRPTRLKIAPRAKAGRSHHHAVRVPESRFVQIPIVYKYVLNHGGRKVTAPSPKTGRNVVGLQVEMSF